MLGLNKNFYTFEASIFNTIYAEEKINQNNNNMKKQIHIFVAMLATLFITLTVSAQGEWKWAHFWSGGDGSFGDYYNEITNTAFDDEGNIYVYGTMGGDVIFDGLTFQFTTNPRVLSKNDRTILLAKFDALGNMLWHKEMKSDNEAASPRWMEVRNDKVFVAADCGFYGYQSDSWLYYWDTLITRTQINSLPQELQKPPFKAFSRWTCLAQFDLDGNLLEDHFVQAYSRESVFNGSNWLRFDYALCSMAGTNPVPAHIDNYGNYYVFTPIQYRGTENDPYTVVVDDEPIKTYDLYLPGNTDSSNSQSIINNAMLYKFSPSGELLFAKVLIDHTDGISPTYITGDTVNRFFYTYFKGISFDENDNMYLTGYVQLAECFEGQGGESHEYPVHIWLDSTHFLTINDISSAEFCNYIIKYDTDGEVIWCNQMYSRGGTNSQSSARGWWNDNVYKNNQLYIVGVGNYGLGNNAIIYFDNEENYLQRFQSIKSDIGFFVSYDAITGQYKNQGIVPAPQAVPGKLPATISNRLFAYANVDGQSRIIAQWRTDGFHIASDTIFAQNPLADGSIIVNDGGYMLVNFRATTSVHFSNSISVNCPSGSSSAVFALYHNPEFATPYVGLSSYSKQEHTLQIWPNPVYGVLNIKKQNDPIGKVCITDMKGKILLQKIVEEKQTAINVSELPSGMYFVKTMQDGEIAVEKFIKSSNY